jgi:hypothetical protein
VIALLPSSIQVHNLFDQSLIQSTPLSAALTYITDKNYLVACSSNAISILVPTAVEYQVEEFLRSFRIKEAKELLKYHRNNDPRLPEVGHNFSFSGCEKSSLLLPFFL